jgi:hypothetical protein
VPLSHRKHSSIHEVMRDAEEEKKEKERIEAEKTKV